MTTSSTSAHAEEDPNEAIVFLVFLKINTTIERCLQITKDRNVTYTPTESLRLQTEMLRVLNFRRIQEDLDLSNQQLKLAVRALIEYLTLPVIAVLRIARQEQTRSKGVESIDIYKCTFAACSVLLDICGLISTGSDDMVLGHRSQTVAKAVFPPALLTRTLDTLVSMLPYNADSFLHDTSFDRGRSLLQLQLKTVWTLLSFDRTMLSLEDFRLHGQSITESLLGSLSTALSLDLSVYAVIQEESHKCLRILLRVYQEKEMWRRLCPGIFSALFRNLMASLRQVNKTFSVCSSLESMTALLKWTLEASKVTQVIPGALLVKRLKTSSSAEAKKVPSEFEIHAGTILPPFLEKCIYCSLSKNSRIVDAALFELLLVLLSAKTMWPPATVETATDACLLLAWRSQDSGNQMAVESLPFSTCEIVTKLRTLWGTLPAALQETPINFDVEQAVSLFSACVSFCQHRGANELVSKVFLESGTDLVQLCATLPSATVNSVGKMDSRGQMPSATTVIASIYTTSRHSNTRRISDSVSETLVRALGPQRVIPAVDRTVADFFVASSNCSVALCEVTEKWTQMISVCRDLLCYVSPIEEKRSKKLAQYLCESTVPLLTSPSLCLYLLRNTEETTSCRLVSQLTCSLLELLQQLFQLQQLCDVPKRIGSVNLLSLLHMFCSPESLVSNAAKNALLSLSQIEGFDGVDPMIMQHTNALLGVLASTFYHSQMDGSIFSTKVSLILLRTLASGPNKSDVDILNVEHLVLTIVDAFDDAVKVACTSQQSLSDLLDVFTCVPTLFSHRIDGKVPGHESRSSWLSFLLNDISDTYPVNSTNVVRVSDSQFTAAVRQSRITRMVVDRCTYLLNHVSLCIQLRCCRAISASFEYLRTLVHLSSKAHDVGELNGPHNANLMQLHDTWPAIESMMQRCSHSLLPRSDPVLFSSSTEGTESLLLSELFKLVATMAECSDDFMASKFRSTVWPTMSSLIHAITNTEDCPEACSITGSRSGLLCSMLGCVERCFSHTRLGMKLAEMIPLMGPTLLPVLKCHNRQVASCCVDALKSMIRYDADMFWWHLTKEKSSLPERDHIMATDERKLAMITTRQSSDTIESLLDFIDSLPEQEVVHCL